MTYAFTHVGNFLLLAIEIWALGMDLDFASRLRYEPGGWGGDKEGEGGGENPPV